MRKAIVFSLVLLTASSAFAAFGGGDGTANDPYQIWDVGDFIELMQQSDLWGKHFIQMSDLDLGDPNLPPLTPIGNSSIRFTGGFDGNEHSISHLRIIGYGHNTAMFGYLDHAYVYDLTLIEPDIVVNVGGDCIGALFGISKASDIVRCNIVDGVIIANCSTVGLLGGYLGDYSQCVQNSCKGNVEGSAYYIGGLLGRSFGYNAVASDCTFEGAVVGLSNYVGGIVGDSRYSTFMRCGSKGTVSGSQSVGGFAGFTGSSAYDCYSQCDVSGSDNVGGFAGQTGDFGFQYIRCYSSGQVSGLNLVGGFVGNHYPDTSLDYQGCFWNEEVNPLLPGIGNYSDPDLAGETTVNMQSEGIYLDAGWDFAGETGNGLKDIWTIETPLSYPVFASGYQFFGGGSGTASDPYLIYTKEHLLDPMLQYGVDFPVHLRLMSDIDFKGDDCPMLFREHEFKGTFDGNGKKICNFKLVPYTTSVTEFGLFRYAWDDKSVIRNLTLVNPRISAAADGSAAFLIVGSSILIENCHVIDGYGFSKEPYSPLIFNIGGITCTNTGTIKNCSFTGTIESANGAGIAVDNFSEGVIENCSANLKLTGILRAGGIATYNYGYVKGCKTDGYVNMKGTDTSRYAGCGGIAAENGATNYVNSGTIVDCCSQCDVSTYGRGAGGLVANSWGGLIKDCSATGSVKGFNYVGGFVGTIVSSINYPATGIIENCYATGNVSGDNRVGGFAGENGSSIIRNCYATGNVSGTTLRIGGFAGTVYFYPYDGIGTAVVDRCYSIGKVTGSSQTGGFVGRRLNESIVTNCYWNTQTSGRTNSEGGTGKTTAQMQTQSTYVGWDFASLWYQADYPVFKLEISPLQARIDAAADGETIIVEPGTYEGRLYFKGRNITLFADNPATTILRGRGVGPVVTLKGTENETCAIDGFTIQDGNAQFPGGGGIFGGPTASAAAAVRNCVIQNNRTSDYGGGIGGLKGQISNCVIRSNTAKYGGGISWCSGTIKNCLINNNAASSNGNAVSNCDGQVLNCTIISSPSPVSQVSACKSQFSNCILSGQANVFENCTGPVAYCCYPSAASQDGNISADPLFVDPANEDYHLSPDSPCIDAGDPASDYSLEPLPNGARINMGAYGNTPEAQISPNGGLVLRGFETISKIRIGRTQFKYSLAIEVKNTNPYNLNNVSFKLIDADAAVMSVLDDQVSISCIEGDQTITSTDVFIITVDRSQLIDNAKLTCELTWWTKDEPAGQILTMFFDPDDTGGDITGDGDVDFEDFVFLSAQWQTAPADPSADIALPLDGFVGTEDLMYFAQNWLR